MRILLRSSSWYIFGAATLIVLTLVFVADTMRGNDVKYVTTTIERGTVRDTVSVSGIVEAKNTAHLAFPGTGIITGVFVDEGDKVTAGEVLATLASRQLVARRNQTTALLESAEAEKAELIIGPSSQERSVTDVTVTNAAANLDRVQREQDEKVKNARRVLLSGSPDAETTDPEDIVVPPVITGTYACEEEGSYTLQMYRSSNSANDYSFRLSGLESGTYPIFITAPGPFGTCGLSAQFVSGEDYSDTVWIVDIPNKSSASYTGNKNAYDLAIEQRTIAIEAAKNSLHLAEEEALLSNASPRSEARIKADAKIAEIEARIAEIDAEIAERSIVAPFSGVITDVSILAGEAAPNSPAITLLSEDAFELSARIPEIDITKIQTGQKTEVIFDAKSDETVDGVIKYISPLALEIDGVAYFKATIYLDAAPDWIRSGLNSDINIIINESLNVLRIPKRFLITSDTSATVLLPTKPEPTSRVVKTGLIGNDGYVEITGLNEGDLVVAP